MFSYFDTQRQAVDQGRTGVKETARFALTTTTALATPPSRYNVRLDSPRSMVKPSASKWMKMSSSTDSRGDCSRVRRSLATSVRARAQWSARLATTAWAPTTSTPARWTATARRRAGRRPSRLGTTRILAMMTTTFALEDTTVMAAQRLHAHQGHTLLKAQPRAQLVLLALNVQVLLKVQR